MSKPFDEMMCVGLKIGADQALVYVMEDGREISSEIIVEGKPGWIGAIQPRRLENESS